MFQLASPALKACVGIIGVYQQDQVVPAFYAGLYVSVRLPAQPFGVFTFHRACKTPGGSKTNTVARQVVF
jgi:hypothetical protein